MTIHLPEDLERFVKDAVRAGEYAREEDVIREAVARLKQAMPEVGQGRAPRRPTGKKPVKRKLTPAEFDQHLLEMGLLTRLPDTAADFDDPQDQSVTIKGEPLSATVIRERR